MEYKYIIMCGGDYKIWQTPRQLTPINGEPIVARTIRLLRENGVSDIAISSNHIGFANFGVPILSHENYWTVRGYNDSDGTWVNGFYPTKEPVCYVFGDVVFSPAAIRRIVNTETNDVAFFASAPPFSSQYNKEHAEPFGMKVAALSHFWNSVNLLKEYERAGKFNRCPMSWELWQIIKNTPLNDIDYTNYTVINDYTCDVDEPEDVKYFENILRWETQ